jgi:uncharacterized protein YjbJ (UPF0337 family)
MNEDILKGRRTQLTGHIREQWGKLTGDHVDRIQGSGRAAGRQDPGALRDQARRG